uniref:[acyl-carrier-protein] S-malonyltransferase n=1 Tax=symbiont bacterium of Paederus fuscipes TaxID=176282 RepID=Q6VT97_UNCXX|nr:putative acyltransferase [symbiont bacterium of Paederus fuscipes]
MGEQLFDRFPNIIEAANDILGYSIKTLCLEDPQRQLRLTQYTQVALYVVNALTYRQHLQQGGGLPDFVAGHSLGEYNALESAGVFSFEDGLRLVQKRGDLMSQAPRGAMAAILGISADSVAGILAEQGLTRIDIANYNAPTQTIISGLEADIRDAQAVFESCQAMYVPLNTSGAFHSRYMQSARDEFAQFLEAFEFRDPQIPVVANVTAKPYVGTEVVRTLADQLTGSVRWLDSMRFLLDQGVTEFRELGPGDVLSKLVESIRSSAMSKPVSEFAAENSQQLVDEWNRTCPIGSRVRVKGYDDILVTKSRAVLLFGHRAAIYMENYQGYFALSEVEPLIEQQPLVEKVW